MEAAALAFLASTLLCAAIVLLRPYHQRYSSDEISTFPQKVHARAVPRIGGVAILGGVLAGATWIHPEFESLGLALILCGLPAFLGGIGEDLLKKVSTLARLLLTFVGAAIAYFILDARIVSLDMLHSSALLGIPFVSLAFTLFAVGGFAHALNIVDGLNGLAGIVSILILAAIALVAAIVGDAPLTLLALATMGAVAGFLAWNFPGGALFLGDGGSYFLGFLVAELAVLLVFRNSEVSPWFALTALAYPVCETLFSWFRRKARGRRAMDADGLHLHTLVYKRLLRRNGKGSPMQNATATLYLSVLCALAVIPATVFREDTLVLQAAALLFVLFYLFCYGRLVRFKAPRWLSSRGSVHNPS